jgi:hypothetical protein
MVLRPALLRFRLHGVDDRFHAIIPGADRP